MFFLILTRVPGPRGLPMSAFVVCKTLVNSSCNLSNSPVLSDFLHYSWWHLYSCPRPSSGLRSELFSRRCIRPDRLICPASELRPARLPALPHSSPALNDSGAQTLRAPQQWNTTAEKHIMAVHFCAFGLKGGVFMLSEWEMFSSVRLWDYN